MIQMTQSELEKISEMVEMGIVASKRVDSNMWGEVKTNQALFAQDMKEMKEAMQYYANEKRIQNGRVGKLENWKSYILGGLSLVSILCLFGFYIYTFQQSVTNDKIQQIENKLNK